MAFVKRLKSKVVGILCLLSLLLMFGFVRSESAEEKNKCKNQLVSISACVSFVSGDAKSPSSTCCFELRSNINSTRKCLCLLVKDRNDPELGFKINATLALSLPSICHAPSNASECPALLHLNPHSAEAQVFEQFANTSNSNNQSGGGGGGSGCTRLDWKII
ncbi:hypothetical protein UlMin_005087 [Ulmus minor]